ncbi:hypothetical protein HZS_6371 [Henneguya salminicola]|nr:hypothetical protein HZS_6371 [Henneguya salminicola]
MDSCVLTDTLTQFVEDEREFISKQGQGDPLIVIGKLEQIYQYYKGMETSCTEKLSKFILFI